MGALHLLIRCGVLRQLPPGNNYSYDFMRPYFKSSMSPDNGTGSTNSYYNDSCLMPPPPSRKRSWYPPGLLPPHILFLWGLCLYQYMGYSKSTRPVD